MTAFVVSVSAVTVQPWVTLDRQRFAVAAAHDGRPLWVTMNLNGSLLAVLTNGR